MTKRIQNPIDDVIDLLKQAASLSDGLTAEDRRKFRILFARDGFEPRTYAGLRTSIAYRQLKESLNPKPFGDPEPMRGNIILGRNQGGLSRYDSGFSTHHFLSVGQTGVGKTVMMVFLLLQYMFIAAGIWVFDFVKRELRGLKRLAGQAGCHFYVCRFEFLRINILDPQGTDAFLYPNICAEFLTLTLGMPPVAKLILKICITRLYERFGLFINPNAEPPVIEELIKEVQQFEGNKSAKEAILIRLQALLANKRQIFNIRRGILVREIARKFIIWEFDGVEAVYQSLVVSYLIAILFLQRVQGGARELVILALDEASGIYSRTAELANEGPSYITKMTCTVRKMLIGIFAFTQTTWDLSNSIIANSGIKVLFQVGSAQDYEVMGRAMGLNSQQIQWAKTELPIGTNIIKMGYGWQKPFINKTPLIQLPEDVSDAEVRESAQFLLDLVPVPAKAALYLPQPSVYTTAPDSKSNLPGDEEALYEEIKNKPCEPSTTEHYRSAGLSTKRGNTAKNSLIKKGHIKETPLDTGRRGGKQLFLEVIDSQKGGRVGKGLHKYLRDQTQAWYWKQNCTVEIEKGSIVDGQRFYTDLAITWPDGKTEAVEVETDDSPRVVENVRKNLLIGFSTVSIVTPNGKVRAAVKRHVIEEMGTEYHDRIRFLCMCFYQ